jgi:predicted dithiol-disulfide oxidoreductase (DUF899 family)
MTVTAASKKSQARLHDVRFPGESRAYRTARDELLRAEIDLRDRLEEVAALRRKLPLGGAVTTDYVFEEGARDLRDEETLRPVRLSQLFPRGKTTLVVYSFMYGPEMPEPCPLCTSILDGLNGAAPHLAQRVGFAVVAKSPIERIRAFARERRWRNLRLLSSAANTYNRDYQGEDSEGEQLPSLNVFVRRDGEIRHFYNTELLFAPRRRGQDPRHVDAVWPIWSVLDFTPEGRGTEWRPALRYR